MYENNMEPTLSLGDVSAEAMEQLLKFMYIGRMDITIDNLEVRFYNFKHILIDNTNN